MEEEKHIDARFGDNWKKYAKQLTKDELIEIALINGRKVIQLENTLNSQSFTEEEISKKAELGEEKDQEKTMIERLVDSHFSLFRRLNQINNKGTQSDATIKALEEARDVNRYFADKNAPKIVQSTQPSINDAEAEKEGGEK